MEGGSGTRRAGRMGWEGLWEARETGGGGGGRGGGAGNGRELGRVEGGKGSRRRRGKLGREDPGKGKGGGGESWGGNGTQKREGRPMARGGREWRVVVGGDGFSPPSLYLPSLYPALPLPYLCPTLPLDYPSSFPPPFYPTLSDPTFPHYSLPRSPLPSHFSSPLHPPLPFPHFLSCQAGRGGRGKDGGGEGAHQREGGKEA